MTAWLAWLLAGSWLFLLSLGFGARHEILAFTAVYVAVPPTLLALHGFAWPQRPTRTKTLIIATGACCLVYGLVAWLAIAGWFV